MKKLFLSLIVGVSVNTWAKNTYYGENALAKKPSSNNSAFGERALVKLEEGGMNCAFGSAALDTLKNGERNIGIGFAAGSDLKKGNNNIYIASYGLAEEENHTIRLGGGDKPHKNCYIAGIFGSEIAKGSRVVVIDDKGKLASSPVSYETLMKIEKMLPQLEALFQKQPEPEG